MFEFLYLMENLTWKLQTSSQMCYFACRVLNKFCFVHFLNQLQHLKLEVFLYKTKTKPRFQLLWGKQKLNYWRSCLRFPKTYCSPPWVACYLRPAIPKAPPSPWYHFPSSRTRVSDSNSI